MSGQGSLALGVQTWLRAGLAHPSDRAALSDAGVLGNCSCSTGGCPASSWMAGTAFLHLQVNEVVSGALECGS